jgi:hypothetical protein
MPRPRSELTKSGRTIGVRVTQTEYAAFKSLGGSKWVRKMLADEVKKTAQAQVQDSGLATRIINRVLGR